MMKNTSCHICRSSGSAPYLEILQKCTACGHVSADMDIKDFSAKDVYAQDYFLQGEYLDYPQDRACHERNFRKRLASLLAYKNSGNLLEIGSAYGFFLNLARAHFNVTGYEICSQAADYGRKQFGLDIRDTDFLTDEWPQGHFDVIVLWDVIEHLANPQTFIAKAGRLLKKGGILALTTGDISSLAARIQGRKWRLIHPPTHIHYFSPGSIARLLQQSGLTLKEVTYPGYWRSLRQILHGLNAGRNASPSPDAPPHNPLAGIPLYLNLYDIMQVIAQK